MKQNSLQKFPPPPTDSCRAQLVEHRGDVQEVMGFNPIGGNFVTKFILFYVTPNEMVFICAKRIKKKHLKKNFIYHICRKILQSSD